MELRNEPNGEEDDETLMRRVRCGDAGAFAVLAGRHRPALVRFFAALLAEKSQADDVAQETLLRLWMLRSRYQPVEPSNPAGGKFTAFLFQIARNYGLNQREKFRFRHQFDAAQTADDLRIMAPPLTQPERIFLEQLEATRRERAVSELPPIYRDVFTLCHYDNRRYAEIADRLGIPVGTVKSRMAEAVRRLRHALTEENE